MPNDRLLKNREFSQAVEGALQSSKYDVVLISAFLRSEVLEWVAANLSQSVELTIITRWRKGDLLSGASDMQAFDLARQQGWSFFIDQDLHAKALLCDANKLFLGSANFTGRGTHLFGFGNNELNIAVEASDDEVNKVRSYLKDAYLMTKPMRDAMEDELDSSEAVITDSNSWSQEVRDCFEPVITGLWVDECLRLMPEEFFAGHSGTENYQHDLEIFCTDNPTKDDFNGTRVSRWLTNVVNRSSEHLRFGYITAQLHNDFINDPKPYRKDVKEYVAVLFEWLRYFDLYDFTTHARTTSIEKRDE